MPLVIREKSYTIPKENGSPAPTGREIIEIENSFNLDGLALLSTLASDEPSKLQGYSKVKALYAVAWIAMTRAGETLSIDDVLNEYAIDEILLKEEPEKKELEADS
jgi:hypothetical protein